MTQKLPEAEIRYQHFRDEGHDHQTARKLALLTARDYD